MSTESKKVEPKKAEPKKQSARCCAVCGHTSPAQHATCPQCGCADWLNTQHQE